MSLNKLINISMTAVIASTVLLAALGVNPIKAASEGNGASRQISFEEIDGYIKQQLEMLRIPGASLVIVEGDQIVHTRGFGVTGPAGETPTPQTPYFIGSTTKSFTSLAVMQLVEEGKIDLDAPVKKYLPWFELADTNISDKITVRNLLNQTSGLSQFGSMEELANFDKNPGAAERQARALAAFSPARPAGLEFEYSNLNFNLAGLVIEAVSGETYADYVKNHIFIPLDMRHSYVSKADAKNDGLAVGYRMWFGLPVAAPDLPVPEGSTASGQLIASAEDMGDYLIANLNGGSHQGTQVVSSAGMEEIHRPAIVVKMGGETMGDYGMGWFIISRDGEKMVFHDGEVPEYFAYMAILPEHNRGIALLVNANQQVYNYALWAMAENAAWMLAGLPPKPNSWNLLPWLAPFILLIPVIQVFSIAAGLNKIKRWRLHPESMPGRVNLWLLHIIMPGMIDVLAAAIPVGLLASGMYVFLYLFLGDFVVVFTVCGLAALVWLVLRTALIQKVLRGKH